LKRYKKPKIFAWFFNNGTNNFFY